MINLSKGQKIDLTKNTQIKKLRVGLGWDEAKHGIDIDCDASCILLNSDDKWAYKDDFNKSVLYYGSLKHDGLTHSGDNRTGDAEGDDETIYIKLDKVPKEITKIVVIMNIYQAAENNQYLGMLKNAYINVYDDSDNQLCHFDLNENYGKCEGLIAGEIYRHNSEWKFAAIGEAIKEASYVRIIADRYN